MNLEATEASRRAEQQRIDAGKSIGERRAMGQFATPPGLACEIARATVPFLTGNAPLDMLEPSAGTGAFLSAFLGNLNCRIGHATAIELDPDFYAAGQRLWAGLPCEYRNADFTRETPDRKYDLVVANPPYVRHHGIAPEEKRRLQAEVWRETGLALSGLAGLYCHFLLLSLKWMKPGGVGVWLVPAEWMSVNYGSALRTFLAEKVRLLRVHRFAADDVRFADALVSSCIVWFQNAPPAGTARFTDGGDLLHPSSAREIPTAMLRSAPKWPPAQTQGTRDGTPRLRDYFAIRRGIATGDNAFFILAEKDAADRGLSRDYLKPILPSPRHLGTDCVRADGEGIPTNARRLFLLDCTGKEPGELPEEVRAYLASGEETAAKKKLCAARTHWYDQEQRLPAPILCSYMGRGDGTGAPVRFILNESGAIATNSFLMLYPKGALSRRLRECPQDAEAVWERLRAIPAAEFRRAGRCYGGGLQKMEPRELGDLDATVLRDWLADGSAFLYPETESGQLLFAM